MITERLKMMMTETRKFVPDCGGGNPEGSAAYV